MSQNLKEIWLFLDSRNIGGIETYVHNLALALLKAGKNCKVILFKNYGYHPLFDNCSIPSANIKKLNGGLNGFFREIKQKKPSVIHTHGYKAGIITRLLSLYFKVPVVSTFHAGDCENSKLRLYKFVDKKSAFLSTNIAVNKKICQKISQSSQVINNFILTPDGEQQANLKAKITYDFAFVGRLSKEKGPERFTRLAKLFPHYQFCVFGDGPMAAELKSIATTNLEFLGEVNSMSAHWCNIDALIISSYTEGLPLVALEAMSQGVAVISSAVGGLPELIQDKENGFLVDVKNKSRNSYMNSLEEVVKYWINLSNNQKNKIKKFAVKTVSERYSADAVLPQLLDIYQKLEQKG